MHNTRTRLHLCLLALVWLLETAWVQEYTLAPYFKSWGTWLGFHAVRIGFDLLVIVLLINLLPRRILGVLIVLSFVFSLTLVTYFQYFGAPLSEQVLLSQAGEGAEFAGYAFSLVHLPSLGLLALALCLKLILLQKAGFRPWRDYASRVKGKLFRLGLLLAGIALIWTAGMYKLPRLYQLAMFNSWTIYAEVFGYLPAWAINYYWNSDPAYRLQTAVSQSQPPPQIDIAFPVRGEPPVIAIIQAESLDWAMLNARAPADSLAPGELVMPHLHALAADALLFKVRYDYRFGTANADFELVTGLIPGGDRIPYKVEGFPFGELDTLPRLAARKGYFSAVFHGNHGYFYGRENGFRAAGFNAVWFTPEMQAAGLKTYKNYILDRDTFGLAANLLESPTEPGKRLQFIITMTTHGPWDYQPPEEDEIFPASDNKERNYFNAMRYLDKVIAAYLEKLPPASLLVLFGDHMSAQKYPGHEPERVPFLVWQKGVKLTYANAEEKERALGGGLIRTDLIGVVYRYLENLPDQTSNQMSGPQPDQAP